jgi:hypothetical protein
MRRWTTNEYDVLFADHPPTEPRAPTRDECEGLARRLDRTRMAIYAQWSDARSHILGHVNASSRQLREYIDARGWTANRRRT